MAHVARLQDVALVRQPVKRGRRHLRVAEHTRPLGEVQIGRDQHAGVLVQPGEQVKQQSPAGLAERQVAEFIEDDHVHALQVERDAPRLALSLLQFECIHQIHRRIKPYPFAVSGDARHADGRRHMRLA